MKRTILITGSNGFVGKNLINFYKDKNNILTFTREDNIDYILYYQDSKYPKE